MENNNNLYQYMHVYDRLYPEDKNKNDEIWKWIHDNNKVRAIKIEHGTKLYFVTKDELEKMQNEPKITDNYSLNIKQYEDGYYSVYFNKKMNVTNINK